VQVEDCNDGLVVLHQNAAFRSDAAPDNDAIGYWAIRGFNTNELGEYGMQWDAEGTAPPTTGSITVNVTPDAGIWTLTGPSGYSNGPNTGDGTRSSLEFGTYNITYGEVSGYAKPSNNSTAISSGSPSDTFFGTYQATGTQTKTLYGVGHSLLGYSRDTLMYTQRIAAQLGHTLNHLEQNEPGASIQWNWDKSGDTPAEGYYARDGRHVDIPTGIYDQILIVEQSGVQEGGTSGTISSFSNYRNLALSSYSGSPDCQAWLFTMWNARSGTSPDQTWRDKFNHLATWGPEVVAGVNAANPAAPPAKLIPFGPTYMAALYDEIYNVGSPIYNSGLTNIADVFNDVDHPNIIGRYYQALAFVSHIFGVDIRSTGAIDWTDGDGGTRPPPEPTTAQRTALKNLVYSLWAG
jgi:hypothetical protein